MKTSELEGAALNWAVERANGTAWVNSYFIYKLGHPFLAFTNSSYPYTDKTLPYSSNWKYGGPIIEREEIDVLVQREANITEHGTEVMRRIGWRANIAPRFYWQQPRFVHIGPTPLIAAMRCYVASKLGDSIDIPSTLYST